MRNKWDQLYHAYEKQYTNKLAKSPVSMEAKYSKNEFRYVYQAVRNDLIEETGKAQNITRTIVASQQEWEYSRAQAKAIQKAFRDAGEAAPSLRGIRTGKVELGEFWNTVSEYSKNRGPNDRTVGQVFFGSL